MLTGCLLAPASPETRRVTELIDRIRHDIQQRLDQLLTEADKLRRALAALAPGQRAAPKPKTTRSQPTAKTPAAPKQTSTRRRTRTPGTANGASTSTERRQVRPRRRCLPRCRAIRR